MRRITAKLPRLDINFYKVVIGVGFSVLWARVMYLIWQQPSYVTFVWFYLLIGSVILKWVIFEIVDRIHVKLRIKAMSEELDESSTRVQEAIKVAPKADGQQAGTNNTADVDPAQGLKQLEEDVLSFGSMVVTALKSCVDSLQRRDTELAAQIIGQDEELDCKEYAIRQDCMSLLASGYFRGSDLRIIVSALGIITELERMGDYAKGIASITLMLGDQPPLKPLIDIPRMAQKGTEMLRDSLDALAQRDVDNAKRVCRADDEIDALYDQVFRELLMFMVEDPRNITRATRLIWVAHNLERFADRITNICEYVVFSVTGEMVDIGASEY
ncbi:MAG: phosphate signaling complex protein PhoU [Dehalococcoidia bacterium]